MGIAADGIGCGNSVRAFDRPPVRALESPRHQMAVANLRGAAGLWHEFADGVTFGTEWLGVCRRHHRGDVVARLLVGRKLRWTEKPGRSFRWHRHLRRFGHCRREFGHWGFGGGNRDEPAWRPLRVYTDGAKTYIQFPRAMAFGRPRPSSAWTATAAGSRRHRNRWSTIASPATATSLTACLTALSWCPAWAAARPGS